MNHLADTMIQEPDIRLAGMTSLTISLIGVMV